MSNANRVIYVDIAVKRKDPTIAFIAQFGRRLFQHLRRFHFKSVVHLPLKYTLQFSYTEPA